MTSLSIVDSWLWIGYILAVVVLLLFDLFVLHRDSTNTSMKHAIGVSIFWIAIALAFNAWFAFEYGTEPGIEFLTGYVVEKSLSVDNLFVILLVFKSFQIPLKYQHRTLFWGIFGAVVLRGILIILGAQLVHKFHWILYFFGVVLIISGVKFLFGSEEEKEVKDHFAIKIARRFIPITDKLSGDRFLTIENGVRKATPLFLALIVIEATDLVFAVDSIPAVLAVTQDSFIAFASNIAAVLGLRALYFVIADWITKFRYLKPGLATILCFVGVKMLIIDVYKIPSWVSLLVIAMILTTAGLSSWYVNRAEASLFEKNGNKDSATPS